MAEKDLQIQQLNVALNQEENAGQEELIRTTKRGNLVKRTKNQWIIDNKITETLSIQNAQYEQGMKYIQDMFDAFCQMSIKDIDERTVADFDGEKVLGVSHILWEKWIYCLRDQKSTIFLLIDRVEKVLDSNELHIMDNIVESIHSFMRLFKRDFGGNWEHRTYTTPQSGHTI